MGLVVWVGITIWMALQPLPATAKVFLVAGALLGCSNFLLPLLGRQTLFDIALAFLSKKMRLKR
jgi:hypothetical protein